MQKGLRQQRIHVADVVRAQCTLDSCVLRGALCVTSAELLTI